MEMKKDGANRVYMLITIRGIKGGAYLMERRAVSLARSSMRSLKPGGHIVQ
jgi:hypothetical protein